MAVRPNSSNQRSNGSEAWTPERVATMRRQDQASARIRKALGHVVPPPGDWARLLKAGVQSLPKNGSTR